MSFAVVCARYAFAESHSLELEREVGGKFHLKLNNDLRPLVNKYREGKAKRNLKRELTVPETAERVATRTSHVGMTAMSLCDACLTQCKRAECV